MCLSERHSQAVFQTEQLVLHNDIATLHQSEIFGVVDLEIKSISI
jgi:hypothetical protein